MVNGYIVKRETANVKGSLNFEARVFGNRESAIGKRPLPKPLPGGGRGSLTS